MNGSQTGRKKKMMFGRRNMATRTEGRTEADKVRSLLSLLLDPPKLNKLLRVIVAPQAALVLK